ncbi:hypothetical protein TraAM80_08746 [Trypanosoma rangeli]|uniref:Uncharacterized protein n=1 Tax=Trypanosoma rangeli TaxID=5698 RepID=A0A422MZJ4_TRYRA|nr:uncharacterized protein TraAM80_08746 [Trypanosoma rangeli]RNE98601.1 hypothetical protein TraAM80_08746 [Trypanosoma rangeli]|eukprot:RNE98601.1 hypothetical protein TraAM80_08746 [Trypanosoma rangeli]
MALRCSRDFRRYGRSAIKNHRHPTSCLVTGVASGGGGTFCFFRQRGVSSWRGRRCSALAALSSHRRIILLCRHALSVWLNTLVSAQELPRCRVTPVKGGGGGGLVQQSGMILRPIWCLRCGCACFFYMRAIAEHPRGWRVAGSNGIRSRTSSESRDFV